MPGASQFFCLWGHSQGRKEQQEVYGGPAGLSFIAGGLHLADVFVFVCGGPKLHMSGLETALITIVNKWGKRWASWEKLNPIQRINTLGPPKEITLKEPEVCVHSNRQRTCCFMWRTPDDQCWQIYWGEMAKGLSGPVFTKEVLPVHMPRLRYRGVETMSYAMNWPLLGLDDCFPVW